MRPNIAGQTKNRGKFIGSVHVGDRMVSRDFGIPTHGFWFSQKIGFNTNSTFLYMQVTHLFGFSNGQLCYVALI